MRLSGQSPTWPCYAFYSFVYDNLESYLILTGQERFTWMTRVYYKDAKGCIIMFDLTNRNSFLSVARWKNDLDSKVQLSDGSRVPCLLLANKVRITFDLVFGYPLWKLLPKPIFKKNVLRFFCGD